MKGNSSNRSDVPIENHPALAIEIHKRTARPIGTEDGFLLDVAVRNSLPSVCIFESLAAIPLIAFVQTLLVDEMRVALVGPGAERMIFTTTEVTTLNSGVTDIILRCTVSVDTSFFRLRAHRISHHRLARLSSIIAKYDSPGSFSSGIIGRNLTLRDWQMSSLSWCRYRKIRSQ